MIVLFLPIIRMLFTVRVIYAVRMRIERNSAALGMLARDLIPNTAPKNSADRTIFQSLNYGNT